MVDACDPDANIEDLRKLIKLNTGVDIKLTKKEICEAYNQIQEGKLPLPPMVMNSTRTYLVDKKSPLNPNDYEKLFDSSTKRADLQRIARKVGLKNVQQMTKMQITDAIGKRLRYMKVHEPVKFARRRQVSVTKNTAVNDYNSALNNNTAVNQVNTNVNSAMNNTNMNRVNNNTAVNNTAVNRVNNNTVVNRVNNNNTTVNRVNNTVVNQKSKINFPKGGLFAKGEKPKFLGGTKSAVKSPRTNTNQPKKKGFFAGLFGKKEEKNFIAANKFKGSKPGYVFRKGEKGLGYYLNNGRVQGPELPPNNYRPIPATPQPQPQPTGNNIDIGLAVVQVKELGLRREQKFINKLKVGGVQRKRVIAEAQQAKVEEDQFLAFLDNLNISNTNREDLKRRMATTDFKQLQVEAQLKADEKANVVRTNEQKMAMFLNTVQLNATNKTLFMNRAKEEGSNVDALIEEAKGLAKQQANERITKKKEQFRKILQNYKLNDSDKNALIGEINETTNLNSMKGRANKLVQERMDEKKNVIQQNLFSFLEPLEINQSNKLEFMRLFKNNGANVNAIKNQALKLQESKKKGNIEAGRTKLESRLTNLGLNQIDQNTLMKKYNNGNRDVNRLIQEAKELRKTRNAESANQALQEYIIYINKLPNLTNQDKKNLVNSKNLNRNKALNLSKRRGAEKKETEKKEFVGFLSDLGLTNENRQAMINKYNSNTLTVNALKQEAIGLRNTKISEKKAKLLAHLNGLGLNNDVQKKFLNRVENTNLNTLKADANAVARKIAQEKKEYERKELENYINSLGLNTNNKLNILKNNPSLSKGRNLANTKRKAKNQANEIKRQRQELENYINAAGLNESNKINILKNNPSLNKGRKMANAKRKAKNQANQIKRERQELEKYINAAGLNKGNKLNILKNNPSLNEGKKLVNSILQKKIQDKRAKDRVALQIFLNNLGLNKNKGEQKEFFNNFNKNVNLNTIKTKATMFAQNKKNKEKSQKRQELQKYLNNLNLTNEEKVQFLKKFNTNVDNANALKLQASNYVSKRIKERRAATRQELVTYLNTLTLDREDVNKILKQFDETSTNLETMKGRAKKLNNSRKEERWVETEDEFYDYLNTLKNLTPNNKTEITAKLNSEFVNWNALKKSATNLAVRRAKERRQREKEELSKFANNLGLNQAAKNSLLKQIDNGTKNLTALKNEARELKKQKNIANKAQKKKELSNILDGITLTNKNRTDFLNRFSNNTATFNNILSEAKELEAKRISTKRNEFNIFMTNIGLEKNDRNLILKNFDANPRSINSLRNKAQKLKGTRNIQEQRRIREELRSYLNTLNMLNKSNKKKLLANNTRSYNNVKNEANQLQQFKKNVQEKKRIREELRSYLNTLNMLNKSNKKKLLANNTRSYNNVKNEANQLQETKKKIKEQQELRVELRKYLNTLNMLNKSNKQKLLANNTRSYNNVKNEANQLQEFKKAAKKSANTETIKRAMEGLNTNNQLYILDKFNSQNVTLNNMLREVSELKKKKLANKRAEDREELVNYMNGLNITNSNKKKILKNYDSQAANLQTLANRATQLNAKAKNRAAQRQELSNYINNLGINGTPLLQKFDSGRSTLNRLKTEANKMRSLANAREVNSKKDDIRAYMKNTLIPNKNKRSFVNRVQLNTNVDTLKGEIRDLNAVLRGRSDELASKRSELSVFLNTLNDLTPKQRKGLINKVTNANTNINPIKLEGQLINKAVKNKRNANKKAEEEKKIEEVKKQRAKDEKRLEKHLMSLKHLTSKEMESYLQDFRNEKAGIQDLITVSKAKDVDNEKDKDAVRNYVRKAVIPQAKKESYLRELNKPHMNITPIRALVNANVKAETNAVQKAIAMTAAEIKKLTSITKNEKLQFEARLKTEPRQTVLNEAKKLDANRKEAKKAKDKQTKNLAESLQTLTTLTRNNRKMFMGRLNKNGAQKVLTNAVALNDQRKAKAKANENARLAEERKRKATEEVKRKKEQNMKNVSTELQKLTNLTKNNRGAYIKKLNTVGKNTVIKEAQFEDARRKREKGKKRQAEEEAIKKRRQVEEEAKKKAEEESAKARNQQTVQKGCHQSSKSPVQLKRENRKKFMNRLPQNGASKVLSNAKKLDQERKEDSESTRRGIEWKLKKIGVTGSDLQGLLKRWNDSKDKTIFDEARKMVAKKREPLLARVQRNVPAGNNFSQARMKWTAAIKEATDDASLQKIERLLDTKLKLKAKTEAEVKSLPPREQARYLKNFMAYKNDVAQRTQELDKLAKTKRDAKDSATRETATKLQSLDRLGRDNRKRFMDRVTRGENSKAVLRNAEKLQRDRSAKQRLEAERKAREQKQAQERKEREQKTRNYERQKQAKLRSNTAKMLQGMSGLERSNRKEFMNRLQRGNDPATVIANARRRDASKKTQPRPRPAQQPKGRVAPRTKKMKAKNRARRPTAKPRQRRR
jgi:hypothetical protein